MLRLQTFGGACVFDESGTAVASAVTTRRTLALLAALAVAGEAGLSRDKLVALLWPETPTERARHSLTQALYEVRRGLQCEDLILGTADLRLNPARITSDVSEFETALGALDFEGAVGGYRGPFLDGFYLPGSPEFEQWTSAQRARFESRAAEAMERLAVDATERSDHRRAAEWWKRLASLRPLDSGIALKLMQSMADAGGRASALQHARAHETLLRAELGLGPDAAVSELARRLREDGDDTTDASLASAYELPQTRSKPAGDNSARTEASPSRRAARRPWWHVPALAAAAASVVVIALIVARGRTAREPEPLPLPQRVVVAPFRVRGAAPALGHLREGIVELLSSRLADDSSAQWVDAGAVLGAWRSAGLAGRADVPRDMMVKLAAQLGAERVVIGSVVGTPERMIVQATVIRAPGGTVIAEATVEGPADSVAKVMDRLAARLLLAQAGEDAQLVGRLTESLPALRAYLTGQAAFQRRAYRAAITAYERALRHDSTFARAALRLAWTGDRLNDVETSHRGVAFAWTSRHNLSEQDQALLRTLTGPRYPAPSTADEQLLAWRRSVDVAPRTAASWLALGSRLFHDGQVVGLASSEERARSSLERALALDGSRLAPAELLLHLAYSGRTGSLADRALRSGALGDSLSPIAAFLRWREAAARGDTTELRRAREQFGQLRVSTLRMIAMASQYDGTEIVDGGRAAAMLFERAPDEASRVDALEALHSFLINQGRYDEALEVTTRLRALQPGLHAYLRLRVLDGLYGGGDTLAAKAAALEMEKLTDAGLAGMPLTSATWMADRCVLAQWRLRAGDTTGVPRIIEELRTQRINSQRPRIAAAPIACAELLDAALAVALRRRDAPVRLARVEGLALTPQTAGDAVTYAPLLLARLYERLGDKDGALRALRKRSYMSVWPRYLAAMRREEARLASLDLLGGVPRRILPKEALKLGVQRRMLGLKRAWPLEECLGRDRKEFGRVLGAVGVEHRGRV